MFNVSSWGGGKKEPKVTQNFCYGFDFSYHTRSVQPEGQMPLQHPAAPVCPVDSAYHVLWCCHANPCTRTRHLPPEQGPPSKKAYFDNEPFTKIGGFWYHFDIFRFICFFLLSVDMFPLDFFSPVKPDPPGPWHQFHHHKSRPQVPHLLPCVQPLLSTPGSPVHRPGSKGSHSNPSCQSRRLNYWTTRLYTNFPSFLDTAKLQWVWKIHSLLFLGGFPLQFKHSYLDKAAPFIVSHQ